MKLPKRGYRKAPWSLKQVEEQKAQLKSWLSKHSSERQKIALILKEIQVLEDEDTYEGQLNRFLLCNFALISQSKFVSLSTKECERLSLLALTILRTFQIDPQTSRLRQLYGEVYLSLSQLYQRRGEHWKALWEEQKFLNVYPKDSFALYSYGMRAARVGNGSVARSSFLKAIQEGLNSPHIERAWIELLKLTRHSHQYDLMRDLYQQGLNEENWDGFHIREMDWQVFCAGLYKPDDYGRLLKEVRKRGKFHEADYIVEAFLILKACPYEFWRNRFDTIQKLAHDTHLEFDTKSVFYKIARTIELVSNPEYLPSLDNLQVEKVFDRMNELRSFDEVLIVWAAAARSFLLRKSTYEFGQMALDEYRSFSLRTSSGRTEDSLNTFKDLLNLDDKSQSA